MEDGHISLRDKMIDAENLTGLGILDGKRSP